VSGGRWGARIPVDSQQGFEFCDQVGGVQVRVAAQVDLHADRLITCRSLGACRTVQPGPVEVDVIAVCWMPECRNPVTLRS
jgi:hypothetical protein